MKLVKNNVARLITLNARLQNGEPVSVDLVPASAPVPVNDALLSTRFAKVLIESGDISVFDAGSNSGDDADQASDPSDELKDLRAELDELGKKYDKRWGVARLQEEIQKALEA